jgi:fructose-1,6-bisphosphatase/inositol monophosphatase family enzyme
LNEKAPNDIVAGTDVLVQNVLQQVLRNHHPDVGFLGEEGTLTVLQDARRVWLVDPICGTTNYAAAIPLFATNVALVEDGQIVSSAVANGGTGELCVAERGRGAWLIESTGLRSLHVAEGYGLVSVGPDNRGDEGIEDFPLLPLADSCGAGADRPVKTLLIVDIRCGSRSSSVRSLTTMVHPPSAGWTVARSRRCLRLAR